MRQGAASDPQGRVLQTVTESQHKTKSDQTFAVKAPQLWHSLLEDLRLAEPGVSFKSLLKTLNFQKKNEGFL